MFYNDAHTILRKMDRRNYGVGVLSNRKGVYLFLVRKRKGFIKSPKKERKKKKKGVYKRRPLGLKGNVEYCFCLLNH